MPLSACLSWSDYVYPGYFSFLKEGLLAQHFYFRLRYSFLGGAACTQRLFVLKYCTSAFICELMLPSSSHTIWLSFHALLRFISAFCCLQRSDWAWFRRRSLPAAVTCLLWRKGLMLSPAKQSPVSFSSCAVLPRHTCSLFPCQPTLDPRRKWTKFRHYSCSRRLPELQTQCANLVTPSSLR